MRMRITTVETTLVNPRKEDGTLYLPDCPSDSISAIVAFDEVVPSSNATALILLKDGDVIKRTLYREPIRTLEDGTNVEIRHGEPVSRLRLQAWSPSRDGFRAADLLGAPIRAFSHDFPELQWG